MRLVAFTPEINYDARPYGRQRRIEMSFPYNIFQ